MKKEFTAKTLDEAKESAAAEFGVSVDEIEFDILEQPRKGLFGMKGNARVMASYEAPAAEEAPAAAQTEESAPAEEPAPASFEDENESAAVPELPADFDIEKSAKVQAAKKYLTDVLHALGLENFQINAIRRDGNIVLDITGDKLGVVIGRRGETLESLAKRTSAKVIKQGRKIALEPMNPYERRIIHSCVAEIEGVSSHSTGVEPYRKVVIYADKPKFDNRRPRRSGDRNDHGERRGSGNTRNYRQSTGFSTSFEREYKRRTYEPDENANAGEFSKETVDAEKNATLYGKIEI